MNGDWRDHMPRGVTDPLCAQDHPVETPQDRRWLWHIEGMLAVCGTNDMLRELARDLRQYLDETCEHHWHEYAGDEDLPAHRQCMWCSYLEWVEATLR